MPLWNIIDKRWNNTLHSPLHAVAAYLNPQLFYAELVKMDEEVKAGIEKVIDKMIFNNDDKIIFGMELKLYHQRAPCIFGRMAVANIQDTHPRLWWDMWGCEVKILQNLAIRLHSQPCSASACKRNWSAFEAAHTKKKNRLELRKLHDLVFIRMNLHLMKNNTNKELKDSEPIMIEKILAFPDVPKTEGEDGLEGGGYSSSESSEKE